MGGAVGAGVACTQVRWTGQQKGRVYARVYAFIRACVCASNYVHACVTCSCLRVQIHDGWTDRCMLRGKECIRIGVNWSMIGL